MNRCSEDVLADAGLTEKENGHVRRCGEVDEFVDAGHSVISAGSVRTATTVLIEEHHAPHLDRVAGANGEPRTLREANAVDTRAVRAAAVFDRRGARMPHEMTPRYRRMIDADRTHRGPADVEASFVREQ